MKYVKTFESFDPNRESDSNFVLSNAIEWIKSNYDESRVIDMFDDEVVSGNWIDRDQMDEEGYESEHDYYTDFGRGEAENAVIEQIIDDFKQNNNINTIGFNDEVALYQEMKDTYDVLRSAF